MRPLAFCCLLLPLLLCAATKEREWKIGRVTADSSVNSNPYLKPTGPSHAVDPHVLQIEGDGALYTTREKHAWNGWCLLIQGEQIKYAVDAQRLFVIDAHGDTCQLDILSQPKAVNPTSGASTDPSPH